MVRLFRTIVYITILILVFALGWLFRDWMEPVLRWEQPRSIQTAPPPQPMPETSTRTLVPFTELIRALPASWPGWELEEAPYGRLFQHQQYAYTMARCVWKRDDARVEMKIMDIRNAPFITENLREAAAFRERTTEHFREGIRSNIYIGFEAYDYTERRGEIQLIVYDRFWVAIEGYGISDPAILREALTRMPLRTLQRWTTE